VDCGLLCCDAVWSCREFFQNLRMCYSEVKRCKVGSCVVLSAIFSFNLRSRNIVVI
jgi:hypothetical protein